MGAQAVYESAGVPKRHIDTMACKRRMHDIGQREEPDRWRRHIVRRHVASDIPQPEIEVEVVDTEAPGDEWGFLATAGRLPQCGGACTPHYEPKQKQEQHERLVDQLLKVYSPPRLTLEVHKFVIKADEAWDLTKG